jgi:TonB family protein
MIPDSSVLGEFWLAVAAHLWQTTLVLLPLFLLARAMRNAPARLVNGLWTIGLVKVFLPLAVVLPLARRTVLPLLERLMPFAFSAGASSVWLGRAYAVMDPTVLAVTGRSTDQKLGAALLGLLTVAWIGGVVYLGVRWIRLRQAGESREAVPAAQVRDGSGVGVAEALQGTGVPQDIVRIVSGSAMPAVSGLLRRRIVISETMIAELTTPELRAVLLHENEHRRRFDPLRSVIQRCALAVFFYYPLLWVVLRRLAASCEIACDEAAVDGGVTPQAYARALARTVNIGLLPSCSPAGIGTPRSSLLHQRLSRLSHNRRYVTMMRHRLALGAAVMFVLAVSLVPLPPLAGTEEEAKAVKTPPPAEKTTEVDIEVSDEDLVQPPELVKESYVLPEYPEIARKKGIGGEVLLDVTVKVDGTVGAVVLKEGVPEYPAFDKNAEAAVRKWKFEPATEDGKPVEMTVTIPVKFRLDDKKKPLEKKEIKADTMPELIKESLLKPVYPEDARKAGVSGKVILEVLVKKDGTAGTIKITEGIEGYPSLAESAIAAVGGWKFKPAIKDGKPIDMTIAIPVAFRLDDTKKSEAKTTE